MSGSSPLSDNLSDGTSPFGLHLSVVLGIGVGVVFVLILFLISLWFAAKRNFGNKPKCEKALTTDSKLVVNRPEVPKISREIVEIQIDRSGNYDLVSEIDQLKPENDGAEDVGETSGINRIHVDIGKVHRITWPSAGSAHGSGSYSSMSGDQSGAPEVSHLGWGRWFTLRELEDYTNGFADENVIGEGGYGIVYCGILPDKAKVAIKNLLNNRGQAEREFKVEVEAIGRVRHKNLVRLLGYCAEGVHRMLVYEYIGNGNLEQWLHGEVGPVSPLTWETRMNIIIGTAKGLAYLHEGLEPKVVHRDIKSSNILLDKHWNPKVSDFGLAKIMGGDNSFVTTRVMGTFGYVAPEYASSGMLNEKSDIYSFGILLMETITGRSPVDYAKAPEEVNLVDWVKSMVSGRNAEGILDAKMAEKPSPRTLKRVLLVALRCVDPNWQKRPKMGYVVHMLEAEDFPFRDESAKAARAHRESHRRVESGDSSGS